MSFTDKVGSFFTGNGRTEFPEMPEFGAGDTSALKGAGYEVLAAMSANEMEQAKMAANLTGGTLAKDKFDNIILVVNNQPFYINKPGFSARDAKDITGQAVMFIPAARVAGNAVKTGSVMMLGASALASGGTQAAMEGATAAAGADQTLGSAALDTGIATVLGPVSSYFPFRQTKFAQNLPPYIQQNAERGMDLSRSTGIGVTSSQLGPARHGEAKIQQLREMPETAYGMDDALNTQSQQIQQATDNLTGMLPQSSQAPGVQAKDAAIRAREAAVKERQDATGALYETIRANDGQFDTSGLIGALRGIQRSDKLVEAGGSYQAIERVINLVGKTEKQVSKTAPGAADEVMTVETGIMREPGHLLDAKMEIDDLIELAVNKGQNKQVRELQIAKKQLENALEATTDGVYKQANDVFATLSQPINHIDEGLAGTIINMPADQFDFVTKMVFSSSASPQARANLKRALDSQDPRAYGGLLRAHMEDRLAMINDTALDQNLPANLLNTLWKNKKTRDMYYAELNAINPDAAQLYLDLGELLKYAKIGRGNNSNTQIKQQLAERYKSPLMSVIKKAAGFLTGTSVLTAADDTVVSAMKSADLKKELSTLSGDFQQVLEYIASIQPGSRKAAEGTLLSLQALTASLPFGEGPDADITVRYKP